MVPLSKTVRGEEQECYFTSDSQSVLVPALAPIQPLPGQVILNKSASPGSTFVQIRKKKKCPSGGETGLPAQGLARGPPAGLQPHLPSARDLRHIP